MNSIYYIHHEFNCLLFSTLLQDAEISKDDAHKLQNRKWVASAVMDSEKAYLECLNLLYKVRKVLYFSRPKWGLGGCCSLTFFNPPCTTLESTPRYKIVSHFFKIFLFHSHCYNSIINVIEDRNDPITMEIDVMIVVMIMKYLTYLVFINQSQNLFINMKPG